jgi:hypothetical protein
MIRVIREGPMADYAAIGAGAGEEIKAIAGDRFHEYGEAVAAVEAQQAANKAANAPKTANA